jgi:glycine oxidase
VRGLERRTGIPIGWHEDGIIYLALTAADARTMRRRVRWQRRLGYRAEEWSVRDALRKEPNLSPGFPGAFFFPTEGQMDNGKLLDALAIACRKAGVSLREGTTVRRVMLRRGRVAGVQTDRGVIEGATVVNCLGSWSPLHGPAQLQAPVVPARGQIVVFDAPKGSLRHVIMSGAGYAVQRRDGRIIAGSTVEFVGFHKQVTVPGVRRIVLGLSRMFRESLLEQVSLRETWSGLRPASLDGEPILGDTSVCGYYVATGHFRHGVLLAPATARIMAEVLIRGSSPINLKPFSLNRFMK